MKTVPHLFPVFGILQVCQCLAGEPSFYREFLKASADKRPPYQIASTSLVDTNNRSPTVQRGPISLAPGVLGGVRLGMSMDEVVSLWGKPHAIGCCSTNYPTFRFGDVSVIFEGNQVDAVGLYISRPWTPQFAGGLVPISRPEEWSRFLGEPTSRRTNASALVLCYETNQTVMTLSFDLHDKWLSALWLTRPPRVETPGKINDQR